jgi:hypothetical protein
VKLILRTAAALTAATLFGLLSTNFGERHPTKSAAASDSFKSIPRSAPSALEIGPIEPLESDRFFSRWTTVRAAAAARARPTARAAVIAWLADRTPEGTANALPVLRSMSDSSGRLWVEVRLPVLPNGRVGWVRRDRLGGYRIVNTHLFVDREKLRATFFRDGRPVFAAPVGIGTESWPTPAGEFMIRNELSGYASPFYGPVAFGTTARSAVLTDWPAGGFVGIHGTDEPQLIPGRVSHGCVRMRNRDILRLASLMPVGTPITIR